MKKFMIAAALAAGLGLGGCATVADGGIVPKNPDITNVITEVQNATVAACGYLPAVETVANLVAAFIPSGGPIVSIGSQIGDAICAALAKKSAVRGGRPASIKTRFGVVLIKGRYVR